MVEITPQAQEKKCEFKDCDAQVTDSMYYSQSVNRQGRIVPVGSSKLIHTCKGHYYHYQTSMYGSE